MYCLELNDLMFFMSSYKNPCDHFLILNLIRIYNTRSSSTKSPLCQNQSSEKHLLPSITQGLELFPSINPDSPTSSIKLSIISHMFNHFSSFFNPDNSCTYHFLCPCNSCFMLSVQIMCHQITSSLSVLFHTFQCLYKLLSPFRTTILFHLIIRIILYHNYLYYPSLLFL